MPTTQFTKLGTPEGSVQLKILILWAFSGCGSRCASQMRNPQENCRLGMQNPLHEQKKTINMISVSEIHISRQIFWVKRHKKARNRDIRIAFSCNSFTCEEARHQSTDSQENGTYRIGTTKPCTSSLSVVKGGTVMQ